MLKELIKDKHTQAENTLFMQKMFRGQLSEDIWADFVFNKMMWYNAIEIKTKVEGHLEDLPGIERTYRLYQDYKNSNKYSNKEFKKVSIDYFHYIMDLEPGKVLAHLYTWYMGDLSGGAVIKKLIKSPHTSLEFDNENQLRINILSKVDHSLIDEIHIAFDWAIKIMSEYDKEIINGH